MARPTIPTREASKVFFDKLEEHNFHSVEVAVYGHAANLALECLECYEVITDTGDDAFGQADVDNLEAWADVVMMGDVPRYRAVFGV